MKHNIGGNKTSLLPLPQDFKYIHIKELAIAIHPNLNVFCKTKYSLVIPNRKFNRFDVENHKWKTLNFKMVAMEEEMNEFFLFWANISFTSNQSIILIIQMYNKKKLIRHIFK